MNKIVGGIGNVVRSGVQMFTGAGSGLYEPTALSDQQRSRSIVLQDTRRSVDSLTWRRLLAYARQLHANCGEVRGPVLERATLANSGGWLPRCVGKNTPKKVRDQYEEWLWDWMRVCDIRGVPYNFQTDMRLESIMLDRDGEVAWIPTFNRHGQPRIQYVANHRIYSHLQTFVVMEDGPYKGMKFNNGIVYDDQSAPVAYFVLDESLAFSQSFKGQFIPVRNMSLFYNPDWCDQGRGITAYAHGIRRIFDTDDIHGYMLIGIKRDSSLPIIRKSLTGKVDRGASYIDTSVSNAGKSITVEELQGGGIWDVQADTKSDYIIPQIQNPRDSVPEYMESILVGVYQGLEWPYEYSRISKEARGANIRVTVEKINHSVRNQYSRLWQSAVRKCGYALATAVKNRELPNGEWWAIDFPTPPEMTADKYREYQESREEYKLGTSALQGILAQRGQRLEDLRSQKDEDIDDLLTRCKAIQAKHPELTLQEVLNIYAQRSPNPQAPQPAANSGDDNDEDEPNQGPNKKQRSGKE